MKTVRPGHFFTLFPAAALFGAAMLAATAWGGGDPDGQANLAAKHALPGGPGLAAAFPADEGFSANKDVIFADNFESGKLGERWDETSNKGEKVLSLVKPEGGPELGQRCLRVEAHLAQDTGGGLTKWFEAADTVFIRFYTRFD